MLIGLRPRRYDGDVADLLAAGRTDFALALAITLYFDGPREQFADGVIACWNELQQHDFTWYADEDLGKWRKATPETLARPAARLASTKPMPFYAWTAASGARFEDASPVTFNATVRDGAGKHLSYIRATFPPDTELFDTVQRWCERVPFLHGYAGFTVNQSPHESQPDSAKLLQIAERFPGIEIDDCGGTILVARDAIKSINWLTLLGPSFASRVSTASLASHRLSNGGVILRAGERPVLGHTTEELNPYREVARALKPIRLTSHPPLGPAEFGSFGAGGTLRWMQRFDA